MKLKLLAATVLVTASLVPSARAENLEHTSRLLSTRQCMRCELSSAGLTFANLSGANLSGSNLVGANLSRANLAGADLSNANLTGASLYGANLTGANLRGALLTSADLREAYLGNADLTGANLDNAYLLGVIGLSPSFGRAEDFYGLAMDAGKRKNYQGAVENFTEALNRKPDYPTAYLGRGIAQLHLGNRNAALTDAQLASSLFKAQGDTNGYQTAEAFIKELKDPPKQRGGGFGQGIVNVLGTLLQLFF